MANYLYYMQPLQSIVLIIKFAPMY